MKRIVDSDLTKAIIRNFSKNTEDMALFFEDLQNDLNSLTKEEIVNVEVFDRGEDNNKWNVIISYDDDQEDIYVIKMDDFFNSLV